MSDIKLEDVMNMTDEEIENLSFMDQLEIKRQREDIDRNRIANTTSQDLRTQVLDHSIPMIKMIQEGVYNDKPLTSVQQQHLDRLWPTIENVIQQTSDLEKIEAKNASDVINLVSKGKLTPERAIVFMKLLSMKTEIDELPKLLEKMSELGDAK